MPKSSSPCTLPILRVRDRLSRGGQSPRIDGKLEDYYFQTAKWDCAPPGELSTGLRGKFFNFTQQILYTRLYTILILFPVGLLLLSFIPAPVVQFIGNKLFSTPSVEKIYVQTDKSFYLPGEAIWFSVYLVGEGRHTPSEISDVVYVELIDPKGNVSAKRTLAAADGFTEGDFQLNADDAGGIYTLQAYTRWMKNFGDDFFFKKKLTVQKIVTPRVLMKLDFEKEAYGSGEEVRADFSIRNLQDEPVTDKSFDFVLQLAGKSFNRGSLTTDQLGRAMIAVELPDSLTTQDGLLNVSLNHEGFTESISRSVPIVLNRIDLQFFPEGGTFVAGLPNRVAFKALNEFGQPADVRGVILDEQERQVAKFDSFHDGMGAFNFEPEAGRQYRAVLTKPGGIQQAFLLPDVEDGGTVMQVIQVDREAVSLSIHTHEKRKIQLLAHQGDTTFFAGEFPLKAGRNSLRIPTKKAVAGTALITLLDETGVPQNERLVLINVHQQLNIELETDKESYTPGQPMDLKIRTTDEHNRPVPARLSLAMVNDRIISFADDKQDNIRSALLMSSELKGEIHEPAFYFDENEPKAAQALDYVMMTHGWRKFEWWDNAVNPDSLAFQPETIDVVSGVVMDKNKDRPIKAEIFAVELSPEKKLARTETDESGRFVIKGVNPAYELMIVARGPARYRNDMSIQLDNVFFNPDLYQHFITAIGGTKKTEFVPDFIRVEVQESDQVAMSSEPNATIGQDISLTLEEGQALSEVVVVGYGLAEKRSLTGSIVSIDAFSLRQLPHSDIASVLQGRVSGISTVVNSGPVNQRPPLFIRSISSISNDRPLIVLDGIPLADTQLDQVVQPQQIQSIEILKGPAASALYGSRGVNGVIAITSNTRKWDFNYGLSQKSLTQLVVSSKGYYQTRKFYQPRFTGKHKTGRDAFPATVYWNPDIRTDARGEAVIRFRNSDEISNFRITVEGISPYGEAGRQEHTVHTLLPLSVDTKLPPFVCFGDTLWMPMIIRNNTDRPINGTFQISIPEAFELLSTLPTAVSVPADSSLTEWIQLLVLDREGKFTVKAEFTGEEYQDERLQEVTVLPMGFPVYA
ncbi:MAG: TonB-dependent receptor plug domain-containing protein, partial [Lewinella sp.]|nr:TonB-dependent receptor plug domain-containing protein [Lewinella sp.]